MTVNLIDVAQWAIGIAMVLVSTRAVWLLLDKWLARPSFRELTRYSDDALAGYEAKRDAMAEVDPDFLTAYARRLAAGEQVKGRMA